MIPILLSLFGGISITFGLLSFFIFNNNREQLTYLYFSIFSIFSGLYFVLISVSGIFNSDFTNIILLCAAIYYGVFPWFIFSLIKKKKNNYIIFISVLFAIALISFYVNPENGKGAIWQIIAHIGVIGILLTTVYASIKLYKKEGEKSKQFTVLTIIFTILVIEEIINTYTGINLFSKYINPLLPLDLYPILFTLIIGKRLSQEVTKRRELEVKLIKEELNSSKLKLAKLEQKRLQGKLHNKGKDLTEFGIEIIRQKKFIQNTYKQLIELKAISKNESKELDLIISDTKFHLHLGDKLELLQKNIDSVNNEFMQKLKVKFPSLSPNEIHLSSLLKLKYNTKEIASIKNISPDSVKVLRYRLRKKLNLSTNDDLTEFILSIDNSTI